VAELSNLSRKSPNSSLLFFNDSRSGLRVNIDTGAALSVCPRPTTTTTENESFFLESANGKKIKTFGDDLRYVQLQGHGFEWSFIKADVKHIYLGADYLEHSGLVVDMKNKRLIDPKNGKSFYADGVVKSDHSGFKAVHASRYLEILSDFPEICAKKGEFKLSPVKHGVLHHIVTQGPPPKLPFRRLSPEMYRAAKADFTEMQNAGLCRPSSSPYASPLHMVKKPDGTWRPCGDYRQVNRTTVRDNYPLPHIQDLVQNLAGGKIFSKIDLQKAFWQIPMNEEDIQKTAVITPFGLFEFLRMPFGLRNAAQTFQRFMDSILRDLPRVHCFMDDIICASESQEQHEDDLRQLFTCLRENGLIINSNKSIFGQSSVTFLGHHISQNGILPLSDRVQAVKEFPTPKSVKELRRFIGIVNFYNRFLPGCAATMRLLNRLLQPKDKKIVLSVEEEKAFQQVKELVAGAALLSFPVENAPTRLCTDASDFAVGAVIEQRIQGSWRPLAFFSKALREPEKRYSTFDRELLAIYLAVRHFRHFLVGREFHIVTDHKPITFALNKIDSGYSSRQMRHLSYISEFTADLRYLRGVDNLVADALSRQAFSATAVEEDILTRIAQQQQEWTELKEAFNQHPPIEYIKEARLPVSGLPLLLDTRGKQSRPLVPPILRKEVIFNNHGLCHSGVKATRRLVARHYSWPNLGNDVRDVVRTCLKCQSSKVIRHQKSPLQAFPTPTARFDTIHVDIVGPLPECRGFSYLFTIVDRFTRFAQAIPISAMTAADCAEALLQGWISIFGVPRLIVTDRGRQFESALWASLMNCFGIKHQHTTAYNPKANGMVERFHRDLKASLRAKLVGTDWVRQLPVILLGWRSCVREDLGHSPSELVFGSSIRLPSCYFDRPQVIDSEHFVRDLQETVRNLPARAPVWHRQQQSQQLDTLKSSSHVFVRNEAKTGLQPVYKGPFLVVQRSDKFFVIDINGKEDSVSVDRLKPAILENDLSGELIPSVFTRSGRASRRPIRFSA